MKTNYKKIAVVGGGVMGTVFIRALIKTNSIGHILVCEKNKSNYAKLKKISSRVRTTDDSRACGDADIVFLAVKPQDFNNLELTINKQTLVCSIMAGVSISKIQKKLHIKKVVRLMPNIASRVNAGFTTWTTATGVNTEERKWIKNLLTEMGDELYVKNEQTINKATAITGSGPAYLFNVLSVFVNSAQELGFKKEEAHRMVLQTLRGVNALSNKDTNFKELISQIASKGGTTEAALKIFNASKLDKIWAKAVLNAYKRAEQLSK
ncbi:MAG: pyrroline-5-carboxylate reductase [Candidatus Paceibacterota bacterium]|jgi:pyrroline-5-carboxylate reductase